jgi:CheY-like chemotaxis protein
MAGQPKILIVENEAIIALALVRTLNRFGFKDVKMVGTGAQAIAATLQRGVDVIVIDMDLPGKINGSDALRQMRTAGCDVPIIYSGSSVDRSSIEQGQFSHPLAYLSKPFRERQLRQCLDQLNIGLPIGEYSEKEMVL